MRVSALSLRNVTALFSLSPTPNLPATPPLLEPTGTGNQKVQRIKRCGQANKRALETLTCTHSGPRKLFTLP